MKLRSNGRVILTGEIEILGDNLVPLPSDGPVTNPPSAVTAWRVTAVAMARGILTCDRDWQQTVTLRSVRENHVILQGNKLYLL